MNVAIEFHRDLGTELAGDLFSAIDDPQDMIEIGQESVAARCQHARDLYARAKRQPDTNTALWQAEMCASFWTSVARRLAEQHGR